MVITKVGTYDDGESDNGDMALYSLFDCMWVHSKRLGRMDNLSLSHDEPGMLSQGIKFMYSIKQPQIQHGECFNRTRL